jgi:tetratricopeptide (TPR) repeat protein
VHRASLLLVLAIAIVPSSSWADASGDANLAIERGVELREKGKDDQALVEFKRAYDLDPTPRARAQMGLAEQALGQWVAADRDMREALQTKGDAWIESRRGVLDSALGTVARHLGSLEVRGRSTTGDVFVDGVKVATLPMDGSQRVEVGTRTLEVRAAGYYPVSRTIVVASGETTRETIDLVALPIAPLAAAPAPEQPAAAPLAPPDGAGSTQRSLSYVAFGVAGASLATAFAGLGLRASQISSYNDDASCPGDASASQPPACASQLSAASTWRTVSIASFIGAGVFGVTGVVLFVASSRHAPRGSLRAGGRDMRSGRGFECRGGYAAIACAMAF